MSESTTVLLDHILRGAKVFLRVTHGFCSDIISTLSVDDVLLKWRKKGELTTCGVYCIFCTSCICKNNQEWKHYKAREELMLSINKFKKQSKKYDACVCISYFYHQNSIFCFPVNTIVGGNNFPSVLLSCFQKCIYDIWLTQRLVLDYCCKTDLPDWMSSHVIEPMKQCWTPPHLIV